MEQESPKPVGDGNEVIKISGQSRKGVRKKKVLWVLAVAVFVILLTAFGLWQMGVGKDLIDQMFGGELAVKVTDATTNDPVAGVTISGQNISGETNQLGEVKFSKVTIGKREIIVSKAGFQSTTKTIDVKRKIKNELAIYLSSTTPRFKIPLSVKDYFSAEAVAAVDLVIDGSAIDAGNKTILLSAGDHEIKASAAGYLTKTQKINIANKDSQLDIELAPTGKIVFVSNREGGKRNIYTANFDGSDQQPLLERSGETENYNPALSPHRKKIALLSTTDNRKDKSGNSDPLPYVIDIDGQKMKKISDDHNVYYIQWSPDGQYIYFNGYEKDDYSGNSGNRRNIYDVTKSTMTLQMKTTETSSDGGSKEFGEVFFSADDQLIAYTVRETKKETVGATATKTTYVNKIFVANPDNTNQKTIVEKSSSDYDYLYLKRFGRDNQTIEYTFRPSKGKNQDYAYNLATGTTEELAETPLAQRRGQLLSDKSARVYIDERDGKRDVFRSDPDGQNEKKLTDLGTVGYGWLDTSLDNKIIFFNISKEGETARYGVTIKGGGAKKIADIFSGGYRCGENEYGCGGGE